jgi:hypothetical protein
MAMLGGAVVVVSAFLPWISQSGLTQSLWSRELLPQITFVLMAAVVASLAGRLPAAGEPPRSWLGVPVAGWRTMLALCCVLMSALFLVAVNGAGYAPIVALVGGLLITVGVIGMQSPVAGPWLAAPLTATPTAPRAYGSGAARGAQSPYASSAYRTSPAPQAETFVYPVPSPTAADGRPVPAEAAFMPYWAAVEQTSIVLSPDNSGEQVGAVEPGEWYLVVGERPDGVLLTVAERTTLLPHPHTLVRST